MYLPRGSQREDEQREVRGMADDDEVFGLDDQLPPWTDEDELDIPEESDDDPAEAPGQIQ
jgi:hypothetical protein